MAPRCASGWPAAPPARRRTRWRSCSRRPSAIRWADTTSASSPPISTRRPSTSPVAASIHGRRSRTSRPTFSSGISSVSARTTRSARTSGPSRSSGNTTLPSGRPSRASTWPSRATSSSTSHPSSRSVPCSSSPSRFAKAGRLSLARPNRSASCLSTSHPRSHGSRCTAARAIGCSSHRHEPARGSGRP